ncbi:MAG TPA: GNAT family N-acetyltransferase [Blastocatellia bacterium]|nr:GNAT family N-acetyltransferase [Blastocatellia bacterium]
MDANRDCTLSSSRLVLEPIQARHSELLFEQLQDPSLYRYIPTEPPTSPSALRARYERLAKRQSPDGCETWLNWAIRLRATGEYIGAVQATVRPDAPALLAYELGAAYRGAGYAAEACRTVMRELVDGYGVSEIRAYVDTRNERSIRLLERLGFDRTGQIPNADYFKGASSDEYIYSLDAFSKAAQRFDRSRRSVGS